MNDEELYTVLYTPLVGSIVGSKTNARFMGGRLRSQDGDLPVKQGAGKMGSHVLLSALHFHA